MDIGETVYVRKYKRVEVLRGQVTGRLALVPGTEAPDVLVVKLDNGNVIPALAIQVTNQERLEKLYGQQNGGN